MQIDACCRQTKTIRALFVAELFSAKEQNLFDMWWCVYKYTGSLFLIHKPAWE